MTRKRMDLDDDDDLIGHYDNLALYRPSNVLIRGLKYDINESTKQACFYIQEIDETSPTFQNTPTLFLWQSKKTYVTLFDESHLPYRLKTRDFKRTFKRRTKRADEGYIYNVKEDIIRRINHETNDNVHLREFTWNSQSINTEDKYILVKLADNYNQEITKSLMCKTPTTYGINNMHDDVDAISDGDNHPFTNEIAPGALAQLTYFTEKLVHIDQVRNKNSSVSTPSEFSFESDEEIFEAENLNVNVSFDPAVMWVTPYEDRAGLQTSLFQLSEKFGDTYESHVYKLTTSGRYLSDISLSMSEVKEMKKYVSDQNDVNKSFKDMPTDVIVVDALNNERNKRDQNDDNDDLGIGVNIDQNIHSTPTHNRLIPSIQINDQGSPRKSNFRNAGLKERLANEDIYYFEEDTNEFQTQHESKEREPTTEHYRVPTTEGNSLNGVTEISNQEYSGQSIPRKVNNNKEVVNYIIGKYGLTSYACETEEIPDDAIIDDLIPECNDNESNRSSTSKRSSLLEMSKNIKMNSGHLNDIPHQGDTESNRDETLQQENNEYDGDENNIQLYDVYTNDCNDDNNGIVNDSNICTCYYDDCEDERTDECSDIHENYNHQPNWVYPKDPKASPSPQGKISDDISSIDDVLLDLNSFILPKPVKDTIKLNEENESDSRFETNNTNECKSNRLPSGKSNELTNLNGNKNDVCLLSDNEDRLEGNHGKKTNRINSLDSLVDPDMNAFIASVQGLLDKHWIIEKPNDSEEFTIQRRKSDNEESSPKRRSLLDIAMGHKSKVQSTVDTAISEEDERMRKVAEYLNSRQNVLNDDSESLGTRESDMNSFVEAVKHQPSNQIIVQHPESDTTINNEDDYYRDGQLTRRKSESIISLQSEDEYLQLPSGKTKIKTEPLYFDESDTDRNLLTNSYEFFSETELEDETNFESFLESINRLSCHTLKTESLKSETIIDTTKTKTGTLKKQKSLLEIASELGLSGPPSISISSDDIHIMDNKRRRASSDSSSNVKAEKDMTSFIKAVRNINNAPLKYIKSPEGELELPSGVNTITKRDSLRGFANLPSPKKITQRSITTEFSRGSSLTKSEPGSKVVVTLSPRFIDDVHAVKKISSSTLSQSSPDLSETKAFARDRQNEITTIHTNDLSTFKAEMVNRDKTCEQSTNDLSTFQEELLTRDKTLVQSTKVSPFESDSLVKQEPDLNNINIDETPDISDKDSDFDFVHIPIPKGIINDQQQDSYIDITSLRSEKEDRSMSISSEWDDVFDIPSSGHSTPKNEDEISAQYRESCAAFEINGRHDTGLVLDMKSYILSARDLPGNDLVTENPMRELDFDYVNVIAPHVGTKLGTATRDSLEIDSARKIKCDVRDDNSTDVESLNYCHRVPGDLQSPSRATQTPLSNDSPHQIFHRLDSREHHLNTRDYNTRSASCVMRMSELFGSSPTPTSLGKFNYSNNIATYSNKKPNNNEVFSTNKTLYMNNNVSPNKAYNTKKPDSKVEYTNGLKRTNSFKVVSNNKPIKLPAANSHDIENKNKTVLSNNVSNTQNERSSHKPVNSNNISISLKDIDQKTKKTIKENSKGVEKHHTNIVKPVVMDTHAEARKVGEWVISKNNKEEGLASSNDNISQETCVDFTDGICSRSRTTKTMPTFSKPKHLPKAKEKKTYKLGKDEVTIKPSQLPSSKSVMEKEIRTNRSPASSVKMNVKVEYKPHQLKYGASEDVDHVIVLPNGKVFTTEEVDYNENDEKNSDVFVEIKNVKNTTKTSSSIISNLSVDVCNESKNYYLVDDKTKETMESKANDVHDETTKEKFGQKNYFLLDTVSNDDANGSFNWYIDDESNDKRKKQVKRSSLPEQHSLRNTINFYEQDKVKNARYAKQKEDKTKQKSIAHISLNKSSQARNDNNNEFEYDSSNAMDSRSCLNIQHSPVKPSVQYVFTNVGNKPLDSVDGNNNYSKDTNKFHNTVRDKKSPHEPLRSPKSPSKTGNCRSVLCVKSEPRNKNGTSGDVKFFHPYDDEEENLSIYDMKKLSNHHIGVLNKHSKSWDRGLNARQHQELGTCECEYDLISRDFELRDYELRSSACDLRTDPRNYGLSVSAYDLNREPNSQYFEFNSNNFYFNSRDYEEPYMERSRERRDSADSSREDSYYINHEEYHFHSYSSMNKRYGSLDCLYPSNYRGSIRTKNKPVDMRRRLFAGYSYLSLGNLPPDHEIIRCASRESRAKELELELNFIRNERRKLREEREFDFYYDQSPRAKKDVGNVVIPEVFDSK